MGLSIYHFSEEMTSYCTIVGRISLAYSFDGAIVWGKMRTPKLDGTYGNAIVLKIYEVVDKFVYSFCIVNDVIMSSSCLFNTKMVFKNVVSTQHSLFFISLFVSEQRNKPSRSFHMWVTLSISELTPNFLSTVIFWYFFSELSKHSFYWYIAN